MKLQKYSIGTGDRFGCQGKAQLKAIIKAQEQGIDIAIVWNKSHREHLITKTMPDDVLREAQAAVREFNWKGNYFIDADHIDASNVDLFINSSNYFTLDITKYIGKKSSDIEIKRFIDNYRQYLGNISLPLIKEPLISDRKQVKEIAETYLFAIKKASELYQKIENNKKQNNFVIEISMDEASDPQFPVDFLFILAAIAHENIPVQAIAPKFIGKFHKGVDYDGDIEQFAKHFKILLAIVEFAKQEFLLPDSLKLSIHSGSDKFAIYKIINAEIKHFDTGIHLKTAGTTWLEELNGLAISGNEGLEIAKEIYLNAYERLDELCEPYSSVIDINKQKLPNPIEVNKWTGEKFARTLTHDKSCPDYNMHFRQLLHLGYKIAAEMGFRYKNALKIYSKIINKKVTRNIFERHIKPLFL